MNPSSSVAGFGARTSSRTCLDTYPMSLSSYWTTTTGTPFDPSARMTPSPIVKLEITTAGLMDHVPLDMDGLR